MSVLCISPKEAPLYKMVKKIAKRKPAGMRLVREVEMKWVEDNLKILYAQAYACEESESKKICPKFVLCGKAECDYYKPTKTKDVKVLCYSQTHNKAVLIDLLEV